MIFGSRAMRHENERAKNGIKEGERDPMMSYLLWLPEARRPLKKKIPRKFSKQGGRKKIPRKCCVPVTAHQKSINQRDAMEKDHRSSSFGPSPSHLGSHITSQTSQLTQHYERKLMVKASYLAGSVDNRSILTLQQRINDSNGSG